MKGKFFATALVLVAACSIALGDAAVESAQQKLKDEGFYYGEINGQKDADTTAAIRRYQIRNGLQITGELNTETLRSLGLSSKPASTPATRPAQTPGPPPPDYPNQNPSPAPAPRTTPGPPPPANTYDQENAPEPQAQIQPPVERMNVFAGTPYEAAPPEVQQDIVSRAQMILMRTGFYRDEIDGLYGPAMNFALRNYQARFGLQSSGRLDVETLASLSLLPEQRTTGIRRFHRRFFPPRPPRYWRPDEPVYIPR